MTWRSKGRPKLNKPKQDLGTIELQQKRSMKLTHDPLDLALERNIISEAQHSSGLALRYLFQGLFGHMQVRAYNLCRIKGRSLALDRDSESAHRNQQKYLNIMKNLTHKNFNHVVTAICIYGQIPRFLKIHSLTLSNRQLIQKKFAEIQHFKDAMHELEQNMMA